MLPEFVKAWVEGKYEVEAKFRAELPGSYDDIVKAVIEVLHTDSYGSPDPTKIHCINDGHYQGTLLYVIPEDTYQPSGYWAVKIGYGSCSGCDTLEAILYSGDGLETQIQDLMTLALHIVQNLKEI